MRWGEPQRITFIEKISIKSQPYPCERCNNQP